VKESNVESQLGVFKLSEGSSVVLDLIRALSSQIVVVGHGISFCGIWKFLHQPNFPWMQNIAVLVFFLLSGFLITYSTVNKTRKQKKYSFTQFFIDRFSRIYAAFLPALLFVFVVDFISKSISPETFNYDVFFNVKTFVGNIFLLQDHPFFSFLIPDLSIHSFGSGRPFWTLAVEWWIYMFFGYFLLIFLRQKKGKFGHLVILGGLLVVPLFNLIGGRGNGLMMYWLLGAIIYLVVSHNILKNIQTAPKLMLLAILLLAATVRIARTMEEYEPLFGFILALCLWLMIDLFREVKFNQRIIKFIRYIAGYSYTLYLVHYTVFDFMVTHFKDSMSPNLLFFLVFMISNILSGTVGYFFETKFTRKIKTRLYDYKKIDLR